MSSIVLVTMRCLFCPASFRHLSRKIRYSENAKEKRMERENTIRCLFIISERCYAKHFLGIHDSIDDIKRLKEGKNVMAYRMSM